MAEHGYARDYDEPIGRSEFDRDAARSQREQSWRQSRDPVGGERDMGGEGYSEGRHNQSFMLGERGDRTRRRGSPRNFGSQQDDHYISWRNRQMEALDRDYDDYCREREQQFHRDFDSWRENRQSRGKVTEEVMELNNPADLSTEPHSGPSPTADATLGTNNSENSGTGRTG